MIKITYMGTFLSSINNVSIINNDSFINDGRNEKIANVFILPKALNNE